MDNKNNTTKVEDNILRWDPVPKFPLYWVVLWKSTSFTETHRSKLQCFSHIQVIRKATKIIYTDVDADADDKYGCVRVLTKHGFNSHKPCTLPGWSTNTPSLWVLYCHLQPGLACLNPTFCTTNKLNLSMIHRPSYKWD